MTPRGIALMDVIGLVPKGTGMSTLASMPILRPRFSLGLKKQSGDASPTGSEGHHKARSITQLIFQHIIRSGYRRVPLVNLLCRSGCDAPTLAFKAAVRIK